ncbi:MAG: ABC transporter substrate-binding protein, partial [Candidatus Rokuibacteriota bacterium]
MKRATAMARVFLLVLALLGMVGVGTGWAQPKTELTIALSSFATEVLDPPLGGHLVKYYLSMMFDYLVGTTPDGQPSRDGGIATRWENSADFKRWTFHLRKGVKFHNGDELTSEDVKFSIMRAIGK